MILTQILEKNAKIFANSPALTMKMGFRTVSLTYKQVYDLSRQIALLLEQEGIKKGDKVLLLAPNSPYWICAFWACLLKGVIVVPLNVQSTPELVAKIAKQTQAKLFFAHRLYRHETERSIKRYNVDTIRDVVDCFSSDNFKSVSLIDNDIVEILYTSGTTGDPKGVLLTHENLFSNIEAIQQIFTMIPGEHERILSILPLSHILEQTIGFLLPFYGGAHIIYAHSYGAIQLLMKQYHIKKMVAVPEFLKIMVSKIEERIKERNIWLPQFLLSYFVRRQLGGKIDVIVSAGAPLDPVLEKKWNDLGILVLQGYGLTETSPLVTCNSYENCCVGSVGKVAPGVQVRIADDGEIQVKGKNVFQGYFQDEQRTKDTFTDDGWFRTGDIGEIDDDGFLFLKGRKKYIILGPGGQNVFPEDVELILNEMPGVIDSCIVGVELPGGMVQVHASILLKPDFDPEEIIKQANQKLASYQQITGWSIWLEDDFPRSSTKKIKKDFVLHHILEERDSVQSVVSSEKKDGLISLLSTLTGVPRSQIHQETKLVRDLQLDSLMRVELIIRVEEKYDVFVDETKIQIETTVSDLEKIIKEKEPIKQLPQLKRWPRWQLILWVRSACYFFIFLITKLFVRLRIEGLENIKDLKGSMIFMPNHLSYADPFVVIAALPKSIRKRISFAAANDILYRDYKHLIFLAELFFNSFPFPRKREENVKLGLDYMGQLLDKNFSIVIFPEGAISKSGKLQHLKQGAGLVAVEMGAPIIPVKIEGSAKVLPYAKVIPRARAEVRITFGKPVKFSKNDSYGQVTEMIEKAMGG